MSVVLGRGLAACEERAERSLGIRSARVWSVLVDPTRRRRGLFPDGQAGLFSAGP